MVYFVRKLKRKRLKLNRRHLIWQNGLVCFQLRLCFPYEYDNLVQILHRLHDKDFELENVSKQLISECGRTRLKREDENKEVIVVGIFMQRRLKLLSIN